MKVTREDMQLYAVTDTQWLNGRDFYEEIEKVLAAGATFLQLREKDSTHEEIVKKALAIKPIARRYGVPFVIDDDIYAALEADVDGVHIGQSDASYETARELLKCWLRHDNRNDSKDTRTGGKCGKTWC